MFSFQDGLPIGRVFFFWLSGRTIQANRSIWSCVWPFFFFCCVAKKGSNVQVLFLGKSRRVFCREHPLHGALFICKSTHFWERGQSQIPQDIFGLVFEMT